MTPPVYMYAREVLRSVAGKRKFLDYNVCARRFMSLTLDGIEPDSKVDDMSLTQGIQVLGHSLKAIYKMCGKKYLFIEPDLCYMPDRKCLILKVGMFEKDLWKQLNKKKKKGKKGLSLLSL